MIFDDVELSLMRVGYLFDTKQHIIIIIYYRFTNNEFHKTIENNNFEWKKNEISSIM